MEVVEMIREWEKGCGNTLGLNSSECEPCTDSLVKAIKVQVIKEFTEVLKANSLPYSHARIDFVTGICLKRIASGQPMNEKG